MYEFNKLLKTVNDSLPAIINLRYEKKELSVYTIINGKKRPEYRRDKVLGTGSKRQVMDVLGGMLAYADIIKRYVKG